MYILLPRIYIYNYLDVTLTKFRVEILGCHTSGIGGLFRDTSSQWLLGYSGNCGYTTIMNAKLQGIYNGLILNWNVGYKQVICETNSLLTLKLIT